jgi:hypothetical protein
LELLNGLADETAFRGAERPGVLPRKGAGGVAILEKVPVPSLIKRSVKEVRCSAGCHKPIIKFFVL